MDGVARLDLSGLKETPERLFGREADLLMQGAMKSYHLVRKLARNREVQG